MRRSLGFFGLALAAWGFCGTAEAKDCNVRGYGAKGDGATLDTKSLQEAIDDCAGTGGGTVILEGGTFVTGTLTLKSNITLHIAKGAVLQGTRNTSAYPAMRARRKCERCAENLSLLWAEGIKNLTITGGGTVDGNDGGRGNPWGPGGTGGRPRLVRLFEVDSLVIRNISFIRSASWTTWLSGCRNVTIDSLIVDSRTGQGNQDGLDIDDCKNMTVRNSQFTTGDDAICFKSMQYGDRIENVLIENIVVHMVTHAAVKMGTESHGGMKNVMIRNVRVVQTNSGALGLYSVDGATIENVTFEDIVIERADNPICVRLGRRMRTYDGLTVTQAPGSMKNVIFRNIKAMNLQAGTGSFISGVPGMIIDGVTLENLDFAYRGGVTDAAVARSTPPELEDGYPQWDMFNADMPAYGLYVRHAKNVAFRNVKFTFAQADARPGIVLESDVTGYSMTAPMSIQKGGAPDAIVHRKDGAVPVSLFPRPAQGLPDILPAPGRDALGRLPAPGIGGPSSPRLRFRRPDASVDPDATPAAARAFR